MWRMTIATRIYVCVAGVIALAVISSAVALWSTWHTWRLFDKTFHESQTAVVAAEELHISVLEQRGYVSSYMLDGANAEWLKRLEQRESNFRQWWNTAKQIARTEKERRILADLDRVYEDYDRTRNRVIELFMGGEQEAARKLLLGDVAQSYDEVYRQCDLFIAANQERVADTFARLSRQVKRVIGVVTACVVVTICLGIALLWLFLFGVALPARALVAEAKDFSEGRTLDDGRLPTDELQAVGVYLRNLMSDVVDTRSTLEQSRRELQAAEQLASVGKLAASVAHEIRNPLTSLKMWLYSIQKEVGGGEALNHKFGIVSGELKRLEGVVRHFLEFARPQEPRLRPESLTGLLDQTCELMQHRLAGRGIRIVRSDADDVPRVQADAEQLKQVFLNLLTNAVEAVGEAGEIQVRTTCEPIPSGKRMVIVRIRDSGPGMSEAVRRRVFEPFFTTKRGTGTGLGLGISARIMARHQGRLILEATGPSGTTFAVHVPVVKES